MDDNITVKTVIINNFPEYSQIRCENY